MTLQIPKCGKINTIPFNVLGLEINNINRI